MPSGVDYDTMFDDSYVDAVYNPTPDPTVRPAPPPLDRPQRPPPQPASGGSVFFTWLIVLAVVAFLVWFVFFKRWNVGK